jgi:hypothetical protein
VARAEKISKAVFEKCAAMGILTKIMQEHSKTQHSTSSLMNIQEEIGAEDGEH